MRQRHLCWPALGQGAAAILIGITLLVSPTGRSLAQDAVAAPAAAAQPATAPAAAQPMPGQPMPPGGKPMVGPDGKPSQPMVGPDGKPIQPMPGETKPAEPAITPRPMKPATPPNADELKVRPSADGKLRFSFNGQPWPAVLEWVATISNMSLDWQELPGDFLNLSTQQSYTVEEVRDLINRHLLARGFTMLRQGEMLAVVNIKKLDPALVPRVSPTELSKRSPYEFVKVSFPLDWLVAESAAEEFKPMLSPNGKLNALKSTNRLEAIDAVANLREIYAVMTEEQSKSGQERLVKEFILEHARASEIEQQLKDLLGIEEKSKKPPTPEEIQMQQQQMMMAQQRGGGQPMPTPEKPKGPPVNLVINLRKNSIVANAPPDKMAIIEQAIKVLDVQTEGANHLLTNMSRMQVYRLSGIDPEPIVTTLNDLGVLDPSTRLQVDKKNRSIIAYASLADHVTIRAMVDKLDGSGRTFEVIQLRRLEADYVAGSIEFMMAGGEKDKQQQRRPYYYDFGYYGGGRQQEETSTDKFRVDADVEHNRLLVWANPIEIDEVMKLLAKLGEIPARGQNTSTVRILQIEPGKESQDALERIRRAWPQISPNPLIMPPAVQAPAVRPSLQHRDESEAQDSPDPKPDENRREAATPRGPVVLPVAVTQAADENSEKTSATDGDAGATSDMKQESPARRSIAQEDDDSSIEVPEVTPPTIFNPNRRPGGASPHSAGPRSASPRDSVPDERIQPPAITVTQGPNGELIVTSPDTNALDVFEEMVSQVAPERRDYQVFYLKHASASWVAMKLEDYFEVDTKKKSNANNRMNYWYGYPPEQQDKTESRRLSKRKNLKFITDIDTNTILVQGADPSQAKLIDELIKLYDQPEPVDSKAARMTVTFTLKHSKAKVVGEAVKDVYRDLLSSNDKALQNQDPKKDNKRPESQNVYITNLGGESEGEEKRTQVSFKGKLSLGIDELSNTLVVSTEGVNLMQNVTKMIEALDRAAQPATATVQVVKMGGQMDSDDVRKAIARILIDQQLRQQQQPNGQNGFFGPNQRGPQGQQMQPNGGNENNNGNGNGSYNGNAQGG